MTIQEIRDLMEKKYPNSPMTGYTKLLLYLDGGGCITKSIDPVGGPDLFSFTTIDELINHLQDTTL